MVDITGSRDCGNSPKNAFVQSMAIAFETVAFDPDSIVDDLVFEMPGSKLLQGASAILPRLNEQTIPTAIVVEHAIAHGRAGAASGVSTLEDGTQRRFAYVFEFKNTTAKWVVSAKLYG
ncbi:MAG: hypothetical protein AAF494_03980 [Pseudomonadota bacterium]